jgi:exodeoxyribonuclease III
MSIKIASYNLWNGAADTYFRLVDFIKEQKFDVLCLQEINGWQNGDFARLKDFADRAGFTDYEYGNSNSEYKLVTLSNLPIKARTVHVEGFWHGVVEIHVEFAGLELVILNLHLDPWREEPRLREIKRLLQLIDAGKPTVITGDFNSLSRADNYPPEFLATLQQKRFDKFGVGALDYRVTDCLAEAGFIDAAARLNRLDKTAPSKYGVHDEVPVGVAPVRVDYAFITSDLLPFLRDVSVVQSEETDKISDHYPIALTLGSADKPAAPPATESESKPEPPAAAETLSQDQTSNTPTEGEIKLH